jgi:hypothetical protein
VDRRPEDAPMLFLHHAQLAGDARREKESVPITHPGTSRQPAPPLP